MKNRGVAGLCLTAVVWSSLIGSSLATTLPSQKTDQKEVLRHARQAYYNLRTQGLSEFQCQLAPNWEALLEEERRTNPAAFERGLMKLRQLQFRVSLGADDAVNVTHSQVDADNEEQAKSLAKVYNGMEQMVSGFFMTANPFVLTSIFPPEGTAYELTGGAGAYGLTYKEGTADVTLIMGKDYGVTKLEVIAPEFNSTLRPQFAPSAKGLLLKAYEADYAPKPAGADVHLSVQIGYQEVAGLQLFQKLNLAGRIGATAFKFDVQFVGCQVKKN